MVCVVEGTKCVVDSAGRSEKVTSGFDWIYGGTRETSNGTLFFLFCARLEIVEEGSCEGRLGDHQRM